jgi:hypothetical protein
VAEGFGSPVFPTNAQTSYAQIVKPFTRLRRQGVVERLQEITAPDEGTPTAVEIVAQVDLTKLSKQ